jgi:hypothetical protein
LLLLLLLGVVEGVERPREFSRDLVELCARDLQFAMRFPKPEGVLPGFVAA